MNCTLISSEKIFTDYLNRLYQEIINIDSKFELYYHLLEIKSERLAEMNIAPAFFQLTMSSLLTDVIVSLAKLFDSYKILKRSDRNLIKFLSFIEQNRQIFPNDVAILKKLNCSYKITIDLINGHRKQIDTKADVLNNLFIWRDKYYAHFDKKYFIKNYKLSIEAKLAFADIRELINLSGDIINKYSVAFDGSALFVSATNVFDIDKILDIVNTSINPNN